MSDIVNGAVEKLNEKMAGSSFAGVAKFDISGEGSIIVDGDGARAGDDDAEVTMAADAETFMAILSGDMDAASAFMTGKLAVEGDMGMAMQLAQALS
ncbi:MAG: SCP2 sterol-binding domain-containing protein [Roseobacter sp.]|jgi:putative sterol carrier protein|nr:SCP2 sterol-binding domain-containing protein [Roseobacter sp.]